MRNQVIRFLSALSLIPLLTMPVSGQVIISEFVASNVGPGGLRDPDFPPSPGVYPDWIELQNTSVSNVNLNGWFLTDAAGNLTKWRLPSTNIAPNAFIVVFADGRDRAVPGQQLRANFLLSAGGEYLALVRPDLSIATEFRQVNNGYPAQAPNVSYGLGTLSTNIPAINSNSAVRVRIPSSSADGTNWTTITYNDSAWTAGTNGVGYGTTNTVQADYSLSVLPTAPVAYYRLDESSGATAVNRGSSGAAQNGTYTGGVALGAAGPRPPAFNGFEPNNNAPTFSASYVAGPSGLLSGRAAYTVAGWVKPAVVQGARTGLFGQNDAVEFGFIDGATLQCWTPNGSVNATYTIPANNWVHIVGVGNGSTIRIFTNGVLAASGAGTASGASTDNFNIGGGGIFDVIGTNPNYFNGQIDEVAVYHRALTDTEIVNLFRAGTNGIGGSAVSFVRTDVGPAMSNVNASAYIRIPFTVDNPTNVTQLTLRMRHDDGFAAYINGAEAVRVNAPGVLAFNSSATNGHSPLSVDEFRLGSTFLVPGSNVLAIQGLNLAANDEDFLIAAEVNLATALGGGAVPLYFTLPTPGQPNGGGVANPGPSVLEPAHTPNVPKDFEDLTVTAKITPTFYPVAGAVLRYRVMFDANHIEVPMFDDGAHGDGGANDGVFGGNIPASAATNGQMIRWYISARDTVNNTSRWPVYAVVDSAEYLGTIVDPTNLTSRLPIVHIFAPPTILQAPSATATTQTGADSQNGSRGVSVFHDGEFYDNIHMALRGNTTAGFNKKSHRLEFNRDQHFHHQSVPGRIRRTSFVADYGDPSYMRQGLAFWLANEIGNPAPFYEPTRLQLNGQFYQLANYNDVHTEDMLERLGYDPNGALYNAAGNVLPSQNSTGGFEKKSRRWESNFDYLVFATNVNESMSIAQRRINIFDAGDIPNMLNYLVAARWSHENDDVWANMSLYHDNDGDNLWRIIPFDMNLAWGAIFYEGGNTLVIEGVQATNDIHKAHPFYGGSTALALSGPGAPNNFNRVYDTFFLVPELRQMYLRRMRTMLDKYIGQIGTPTNTSIAERKIVDWYNEIAEEAVTDRILWGWPAKGGQNNFDPPAGNPAFGTAARTNAALTWTSNGVNAMLDQFVRARRQHFLGKHSVTNTALAIGITKADNAGIPLSQSLNAVVQISQVEFSPSSGNQGHEFIQLTNPNPFAVDISGWELDGGVDFEFAPGTVLVAGGVLYVTPDIRHFRTRTTGPRSGQGLFVVGPYEGSLDARGETISLVDNAGRLVNTNAFVGTPSGPQQFLRITEVMYAPAQTNVGSPYGREEFEYIELKNIGPSSLNLLGVHFTNGIEYAFTTNSAVTNLAPGQVVVLVKNAAAFTSRHGAGATIAGVYSNNLDNAGERVKLDDAIGEEILDFTYNNTWYPITDGLGFSLVIVNENAPYNTWDEKESWRPSGTVGGSPGENDPAQPTFAFVLVNEVLANSDPGVDSIELWNAGTNAADISHWWISDDFYTPQKYRVPPSTVIPAGGYMVFSEAQFNPTGMDPGFGFSAAGDEAYIFSGDAAGNLSGFFHGFDFDASEPNVSFGRYLTSDGDEHFVAQSVNTFGTTNAAPKVGPIVISEIMYHPPDLITGDDSNSEYIELHNISQSAVALYDPTYPTNVWRLDDAVEFSFSTNTTIPAGGFLLVVNFDPDIDAAALAAFRAKYGLGTGVAIVGPWNGQLDNSEDDVELRKPDTSVATNITSVLVEKVHYHDVAPWPGAADGFGPALIRIVEADFANDSTNWLAGAPTPGAASTIAPPPVITSQPANATVVVGNATNFTVVATGTGLSYQWFRNGTAVPGATGAVLNLSNIRLDQAGTYSVIALSGGGATLSSNAQLAVLSPVAIITHPLSQLVLPGTNVTLSVAAIGNGAFRYQWRFEGADIANATNSSYNIVNANLQQHHGNFSVVVTDDVSTILSSNALIFIRIPPFIVVNPAPQTVAQGQTARFSIMATGAPPLNFRWLRNGQTYLSNAGPTLIITNCQLNGSFRVVVTNLAGTSNSLSATLTVLPDSDGDGLPDAWETNYFGNLTAENGNADSDGDGMIDRDEFSAGTIPTNASSVLKITISPTNRAVLQFVAQTNLGYTVQYQTNLNSGIWNALTNIGANTNVRALQLSAPYPPPESERYYRVVTPPVP